eukprot:scpid69710/ scgid33065/ 
MSLPLCRLNLATGPRRAWIFWGSFTRTVTSTAAIPTDRQEQQEYLDTFGKQWVDETAMVRNISRDALEYVQRAIALPPRQRLSLQPPQTNVVQGRNLAFISECLARSLVQPGQWSKESLIAFSSSYLPLAQELDRHKPMLLQQIVLKALIHLPTSYSLTGGEMEALSKLMNVCRSAPLTMDLVRAVSLRRHELATQLPLVRNPSMLMVLFTLLTHTLHGSWHNVPQSDRLLASAVLDQLSHVLKEHLNSGDAHSFSLAPTVRTFCSQLLFCRFDHTSCLHKLARCFEKCLESQPTTLSLLDCAFMAFFLSVLRVSAKPFFNKLRPVLSTLVTDATLRQHVMASGTAVPYLLAWAYLEQKQTLPGECLKLLSLYPARKSDECFGISHDMLATCVNHVRAVLHGPSTATDSARLDSHSWNFWSEKQVLFYLECGFEVDAEIAGVRVAMAALVKTNITGSASFLRWPRSDGGVRPHQVTSANADTLPGIPVVVLPCERMHPWLRLSGPYHQKVAALEELGWGVATVDEADLVTEDREGERAEWLQQIVCRAARNQLLRNSSKSKRSGGGGGARAPRPPTLT